MVIRKATPPGSSGRVFGFIYCGLDIGAATTPTLYGWFLDLDQPRWIFLSSGSLLLLAALLVVVTARFMVPRATAREAAAGSAP
jgi:MFS family permease